MSASKLTELSLAEARDGLRRKDFTSVELTQEHIAAMEAGRKLNAVILETPEKALDMAKTSDTKLSTGEGGALEGLPIGVKDLFCTKGVRTTACSKILGDFTPLMKVRLHKIYGMRVRFILASLTMMNSPWGRQMRHPVSGQ